MNLVADGATIKIVGDVDFQSVVSIWKQGLVLMQSMQKIKVELSGLKKCDSSILALCSAWIRAAHSKKKEIVFLALPAFMQDLVRVHGLDGVLPVQKV